MRIEVYVCETLNPSRKELDFAKRALIELFGGLTEITHFEGYFKNGRQIERDFGKIWIIFTDKPELAEDNRFKAILLEIKALCKQKSQAYALNSDLRLI